MLPPTHLPVSIVVPTFAVLMELVRIRVEETTMGETFGETWQAYKAKVRRWIQA